MTFEKITNFEADSLTLYKFVDQKGPSRYLIPDYQRRFVWDTKNLTDFIESIYSNDRGYYIGTFVDVRPNQRSYDYEIIDGQQRLTSLTFCVKVLTDILAAVSIEQDKKIPQELTDFSNLFLFHENSPRLVFNNKYFNNHLALLLGEINPLDSPEIIHWYKGISDEVDKLSNDSASYNKVRNNMASYKSVTRLFNTYKDIQKYFSDFTFEELIEAFYKIVHIQLIEITCDEKRIVNTLFEGMNSKGVLLSNAELIKNKLFARIDAIDSEDFDNGSKLKSSWDEVDLLFYVENDKRMFDKFLRHLWISKHGYISGNKVYDAYVDEIKALNSFDEVCELINEIHEYADYYLSIRHMNLAFERHAIKTDQSIYTRLNDFGKLNNEQIYEVLLSILRIIKTDPHKLIIGTRDLRALLNKLWSFCFRLQFIPVSPSKYENRLADICQNIVTWSQEDESLALRLDSYIAQFLRPLVNERDQFVGSLMSEFGYKESMQNHKLLEKIFYGLFIGYDTSRSFDGSYMYTKATIEHILPQKAELWNYRRSEIKDFVNNIGNLTLLDEYENNIANNLTFTDKYSRVYSKNKYLMNKDLIKYKDGFVNENITKINKTIEERSREIADRLFDIYSV